MEKVVKYFYWLKYIHYDTWDHGVYSVHSLSTYCHEYFLPSSILPLLLSSLLLIVPLPKRFLDTVTWSVSNLPIFPLPNTLFINVQTPAERVRAKIKVMLDKSVVSLSEKKDDVAASDYVPTPAQREMIESESFETANFVSHRTASRVSGILNECLWCGVML